MYQAIRDAHQIGSQDEAGNAPLRDLSHEHPAVQKAYLTARQRYVEAMERAKTLAAQRNMCPEQILVLGVARLWDKSIEEEKPAKGVKGTLLTRSFGRDPIFRVYVHPAEYRIAQTRKKENGELYDESAWEFVDYDIAH